MFKIWLIFVTLALINLFAVIIIVLEDVFPQYMNIWAIAEVCLAGYFFLEFIVEIIIKKPPRIEMIYKFDTYINILSFLPIFVRIVLGFYGFRRFQVFYLFRVLKSFRIIKLIKYLNDSNRSASKGEINNTKVFLTPVRMQKLILYMSIGSTIFITSGIIILIDDQLSNAFTERMNFVSSIYYVAVTGSSLGYGDIYPTRPASRFLVIFIIIFIIYVFAHQISKIITEISNRDPYDTQIKMKNHDVIFLFDDNFEVLSSFLFRYITREQNYEGRKRDILLISHRDKSINSKIRVYIELKIFEGRIQYIPSKGAVDLRLIESGSLTKAHRIYFL